jgi:uncharacterized protein YfeS
VNDEPPSLDPEDAHPRAKALLTDAFFWDLTDEASPFGNETGADTLAAYRDHRAEEESGDTLGFLKTLLDRWEVADAHWNAIDQQEVEEAGRSDEWSLLTRDEIIVALAFAQLIEDGEIDGEVRRRAILATHRQELPPLLIVWKDALTRSRYLVRMRQALSHMVN